MSGRPSKIVLTITYKHYEWEVQDADGKMVARRTMASMPGGARSVTTAAYFNAALEEYPDLIEGIDDGDAYALMKALENI